MNRFVFGICGLGLGGMATLPAAAQSYSFKNLDGFYSIGEARNGASANLVKLFPHWAQGKFGHIKCQVQSGGTKTVIAHPGGDTYCYGIANNGTVAGLYFTPGYQIVGFTYSNGKFSGVTQPNATARPTAISNSGGNTAGNYDDSAGVSHAFVTVAGATSNADAPPVANSALDYTQIFGINDRGTAIVEGVYTSTGTGGVTGYVNYTLAGGVFTKINWPGSFPFGGTAVLDALNNNDQAAGYYYDSQGVTHGLVFDLSKQVALTVDAPGAAATTWLGIDDSETLIGYWDSPKGNNTSYYKAVMATGSIP